jgi:hypothetical protein
MKSFRELRKSQKVIGVLAALLFFLLTFLSVYGLFLDNFIFEMRRTTYFFEGANKVIFCMSSLLFNGTMAALSCGGLLVVVGVLPKRDPGSLNDKLFTVPLGLGFTGLVFSSLAAGL